MTSSAGTFDRAFYHIYCQDGCVAISRGMMVRLCQEGHVFGHILAECCVSADAYTLSHLNVKQKHLTTLVMAARLNSPVLITNRAEHGTLQAVERLGGFKFVDRELRTTKTPERRNLDFSES